jgi:uncharacterized membrane protein YqhA
MVKLLEKSKNLTLIAVVFSLIASVSAYLHGAVKTVSIVASLVASYGKDPFAAIALIELMDTFLIATALLIFAVGMYELFIGDLDLPDWLEIHNLHDLKAKLGSVVVLVMAVTFLKHLVEWKDPMGTMYFAIAVGVVSASLIAFSHFGGKD